MTLLFAGSGAARSADNAEPLGPSSRRTGLVISELMYHPAARPDGRNLEFLELYNSVPVPEDLSGHRLTGAIDFTFPAGTVIGSNAFLVVAAVPADLAAVTGLAGVLGGYAGTLPNNAGTVRLLNPAGAVLLEVKYADTPPWPPAADGAGHSLVLARPSLGAGDAAAWAASELIGGSPGTLEPPPAAPLHDVVINEVLARAPDPAQNFIELYNHSPLPADLSGAVLSVASDTNRFTIPAVPPLAAGGFRAFAQAQLGFTMDAAGDTVYLTNPEGTRVLDAVRVAPQPAGQSAGRHPDGAADFDELRAPTPGTPNATPQAQDIVLNEIMFDPVSGDDNDQFLELYNQGAAPVDLGGWQFVSGVTYAFPPGQTLAAGGYLVVAKNAARLLTNYPTLTAVNTLGDFHGTLSHGGERITLVRPDELIRTNALGAVTTNLLNLVVDDVTFGAGGRWGQWAAGGGSSLELIDPRSDHRRAANWADSDDTAKSEWTSVESAGVLDNGGGGYPINNLQIILLDAGECLIDDVEVIGPGDTNRIGNGTFESGLTNWFGLGTHERITLESSGHESSASLHLMATGKGDTGANRVRTPLTGALASRGTNVVTLRARCRWLHGHPEILLRLRGSYLEAAGRLAVPKNLGTPGAPNSRARANAGPAIADVSHSPKVPAANVPVVVTARVQDPDGLSRVTLNYRLDPATNTTAVTMTDDGTGADAVAGDGIFSGTLPGFGSGVLAAFSIEAVDAAGSPVASVFPADAPGRECLVRWGESVPPGRFGTYRLWITQATAKRWASRVKLSNDPLDATFVYGNDRVIYNVGALYSGSPYHSPGYNTPTGAPCDYTLLFPDDDRFLGVTDLHLSWPGNGGDDPTGQREQAAYWIARELGLPFNYRRFMILFVNGVRRNAIVEDTQRANSDVVAEWFPNDTDGDLFKIAGWFEFDDQASGFNVTWSSLGNFTTLDSTTNQRVKKAARYRWNWEKRAWSNSGSDFANLFALVDAVQGPTGPEYTARVEALVDVEEWMRTVAVEHLVGNWDSFVTQNGQNMYAYKPVNGKWQLLIWDLDIALGGIGDGPTSSLFGVTEVAVNRMLTHPPFRRAYYRALQDAVDGPLVPAHANAMLDAKYAALRGSQISVSAPTASKTYISQRRANVLAQLAKVAAPFAITSGGGAAFETNLNQLTLTGTAPVEAKTILVNGREYPITWTTLTNFSVTVPLVAGVNPLLAQGVDRHGATIPGLFDTIQVTFTGTNAVTPTHLVINEWMAANTLTLADPADGRFDDWFELYNPGTDAVDLTGYAFAESLTNATQFVIPTGYVIPPLGHSLVWADGTPAQNAPGAELHVNFKLSRAGQTLALFAPDTSLVDAVSFAAQTDDVSQGRWPDGAPEPFYAMPQPTPRAPNVVPAGALPEVRALDVLFDASGQILITWVAQAGRRYQLQFKDDVSDPLWHDVPGEVAPVGNIGFKSDPTATGLRQRFYRVLIPAP